MDDILSDIDTEVLEASLIDADRRIVEMDGLKGFTELAWPIAEGNKEFTPGRHIDMIAHHLEAVYAGELTRLLINIPPRHMKSYSCCVMGPAYDWIYRPWMQYLFISYSQFLSVRDNVRARRIIQSKWYQDRWGHRYKLAGDQSTKLRYDNTRGGYRIATSVDGSLTGEGGDIIVVDDPHNVVEAESETIRENVLTWFDEALPSRFNDPKTGVLIVIMQRVHERDLSGHIISKELGYEHLCLPARYEHNHPFVSTLDWRKQDGELLWPERFGEKELSTLEKSLGIYGSAGQLQQRPSPREGGMFKRKWFKFLDEHPRQEDIVKTVRAWDLAGTEKSVTSPDPDYTASVKMHLLKDGTLVIPHATRFRKSPRDVEESILDQAKSDGKLVPIRIPIDAGQAGKAQHEYYVRAFAGYILQGERESGDKAIRAMPFASQAEGGNVYLVRGEWNDGFLDELTTFPTAAHDDWVDAASGAFRAILGGNDGLLQWYRQQYEQKQAEDAAHPKPKDRFEIVRQVQNNQTRRW